MACRVPDRPLLETFWLWQPDALPGNADYRAREAIAGLRQARGTALPFSP